MNKVVINCCFGGFSLSNKALEYLEENFGISTDEYSDMERHHPALVATVEHLGDNASGRYANLQVINIHGNQYRVEEYDGSESIITPDTGYEWVTIS